MADALTAPFEVAALVLLLAGIAKLRGPATAARALETLELPASTSLVRVLAAGEVGLAIAALIKPTIATGLAIAAAYAAFAVVALALVRRRAACGCFGDTDAPASLIQVSLSAVLAVVTSLAGASGAHGIGWVAHKPPVEAFAVALGTIAAAYAATLVYTTLPQAWTAWSPR